VIIGVPIRRKLRAVLDVTGEGVLLVPPTPLPISPGEVETLPPNCKIQRGDDKPSLNLLMPRRGEVQTKRLPEKLQQYPLVPQIPDLRRLR